MIKDESPFLKHFLDGNSMSTIELLSYLNSYSWKEGDQIPYFWVNGDVFLTYGPELYIPGYKGHILQIPLSIEKWNYNPYLVNIRLGTELYFPYTSHPQDPSLFITLIYKNTGWTLKTLDSIEKLSCFYKNKNNYLNRFREFHYRGNYKYYLTQRHTNKDLKKKWSKIKTNKVNLLKYPDRPTYWVQNDVEYTTKEILSFVKHQSDISDVNSIPYLIGLLPIGRHKKNDTTERPLELKTIHPICISVEDKLKIDISDLLTKRLPKIDPRSNHNFVLVVTTKDFEIRLVRLKNKKWKCVDNSFDINRLEKVII